MKKLFLAFALAASVAFVGCEKNEENQATYTLTVSPATAEVGDDVEFTVEGENAADYQWQACYNSTTDNDNNGCWSFNESVTWTYTVALAVGEYTVYASSKTGDLHTEKFTFTVTE